MNAMPIETISRNRCFGGVQAVYSHDSPETGTPMRFGVFLPPQASAETPVKLAAELKRMAGWLGLEAVRVEPRGDLAGALADAV